MNPVKILLVEDDEELGQAYVTRLQAEGMEVNWTKNGEEALAETVRFKPDLLLLDIMMPRISGFDVLDILKNTPETRDTKIIVLSALSSPEDIEKARMLGANDYLVKAQVTVADVVETIRRHTGAPANAATLESVAPVQAGAVAPDVNQATSPESVAPAPADPSSSEAGSQPTSTPPAPSADPTQPPTPGAVITPQQKTE
ncbi:response regulator [bacterium]|nr:response regulator [bacterium]